MENMKLPKLDNPHLSEYKLNALKKIKEDPFFNDIINDYELDDDDIIASASKLLKFKSDREKCSSCNGKCNKIPEKIQMGLVFDAYRRTFDIEFNTCSLYKEIFEKRRKFLRMDFPINYLDYDFVKELTTNDYYNIRQNLIFKMSKRLKGETNMGLYLYGSTRIGKTFVSSLFATKFIDKNLGLVSFASSNELFKELMDLNFTDKTACADLLKSVSEVDLLVLDGFGDEYKSDFTRDTFLYPLLQERLANNKLTIITSNYTIDEIVSMYSLSKASLPKVRQLKNILLTLFEPVEVKGFPYSL